MGDRKPYNNSIQSVDTKIVIFGNYYKNVISQLYRKSFGIFTIFTENINGCINDKGYEKQGTHYKVKGKKTS